MSGDSSQRPDRDARRARWAVVLCGLSWVAGLVATAVVAWEPDALTWSRRASTRLLMSTADVGVALLVAYLLLGRFLRLRRVQDLLVAEALFVLAGAGFLAELVPALGPADRGEPLLSWSALLMRVGAAALVLASVLVGQHRRLTEHSRPWVTAPVPLLVAAVAVLWTQRERLPAVVEVDAVVSGLPTLDAHALLLTGQAVGAVAFGIASIAYARQAMRHHDELVLWAGPAFALAACARLSYSAQPSLHTEWVSAGDLLRTACYGLLLVGAAREIGAYWHAFVSSAVLEDRRRLARELHDGVVQELAYLRGAALAAVSDPDARDDIVGACDRALDEARAAVDVLGRHPEEPLALTLHRAAEHVAGRYGGRVVVDLDDSIRADSERRHALVRITREAVANALRHGRPQQVCLRLEHSDGSCRLVVEDDGSGFVPDEQGACAGGYGLTSMSDRARALPGDLAITSEPGVGTTLVVTWADGEPADRPRATAGGREARL